MEYNIVSGALGAFYALIDKNDAACLSPTSKYQPETPLMQYTGCHDSSNKEIYEGDIIQYSNGDVIRIGYIEFMSGIFFLNNNDETDEELGYLLVSNLKVIGNKFERSELLKTI